MPPREPLRAGAGFPVRQPQPLPTLLGRPHGLRQRVRDLAGSPASCGARASRGFTLIEVLVVLALIGAFAAIWIGAASAVRRSADRARVKVQFAQWATAIEAFRNEYGHYPQFDASHKINGGAGSSGGSGGAGEHLFHDLLAGQRRDGQSLAPGSAAAAQNRRHIRFYSFSAGDFTALGEAPAAGFIQDALGNTDIVVLVDRNLDGRIDAADYAALPAVMTREGVLIGAPPLPPNGLPLSVAFYSAGPTATAANPEFVVNW